MSGTIILFFVLNLVISCFNAWSVGKSWAETKAVGGLPRFMAWCGAAMSACGFTWCYLVILCAINSAIPEAHRLPAKYMDAVFALGYLAIVLPVIGSGIAITIQSWMIFWRERTFVNGAIAGYNSFADIYNVYSAMDAIPDAFNIIGKAFDGDSDDDDDGKGKLLLIVVVLAVICVIAGALTTTIIIRATASGHATNQLDRAVIAKRAAARERA